MMAPVYPLAKVARLHRAIVARGAPHVVFVGRRGGLDCAPAGGPRHASLERDPGFSARVAGVFDGSASVALLAAALREVGR